MTRMNYHHNDTTARRFFNAENAENAEKTESPVTFKRIGFAPRFDLGH